MNWLWIVVIVFVVIIIIAIIILFFVYNSAPPGYYYSTTIDNKKRWLAYSEEFLYLSPDKPGYKFLGEVGEPLMYGKMFFTPVRGSAVPTTNATNKKELITISQVGEEFKMGVAPDCYMFTFVIPEINNYIYMYTESVVKLHSSGEWQYQICGEKNILTTPAKPIPVRFERSAS